MEGFGIDWKILLGQIINFAILLYLLKRFVYKSFLSLLEQRRNKIREGIEKSEGIEERIKEIKKSREKILVNAQEEAVQIVKAGEERGKKQAEQIIFQTEKEKEKIIQEAMNEAARKKQEAKGEIEEKSLRTGLLLAQEILEEKLDLEKDKNLIERFLTKFQKKYGRSS